MPREDGSGRTIPSRLELPLLALAD